MKEVYVLDAVNFLFRSYHAIGPMTNPKGESTGALYGFIRSVFKIIKDHSPKHLVAVFDGPDNSKSRRELYSDYKIHRAGMPEDLVYQLKWALKFCEIAGIPLLSVPGVEADDVMGSIAKWAEQNGATTYLCSSDKDLCQLVSERTFVLNVHKNNLVMDREEVKKKFDVYPEQIIDYLAMMGDASDNIPGLPGIGPKTASALLNEYTTLENIFANTDKLKGKKKEVFEEEKETALLSKQLATIHLGIPFPKEEEFFRLKEPELEKIKGFYQEMNFLTLLKELQLPERKSEELDLVFEEIDHDVDYILINDEKELEKLTTELSKEKELCIDTESTSLDIMQAELVGIGISNSPKKAWYVPLNGNIDKEKFLNHFKTLLENPEIAFFGHNIKYDLHILKRVGINVPNIGFDTMVASYLITPQKQRHSLDTLSLELFGKVKTPITDLIGKGKKQISMLEIPLEKVAKYCAEDVDYTYRLKEVFAKEVQDKKLTELFENIELPLIPILFQMEETGIFLDREKLQTMHESLEHSITSLRETVFDLAGETFNLNSPKQLGEVLFDRMEIRPAKKTATGYSTSADVLENLRDTHPIIEKVLQYRGLEKLRSTYVDALPQQIDPKTGRIHCTFSQTTAATGRLSSVNPNLQNIPVRTQEGRKIRTAFIPEKANFSFLSADYSQIELRLLAHLSDDPTLIKAFQEGEDIHSYTAALVYNVPLDSVTKEMRYAAKAVNFGILYGQGPFGLSKEIGITQQEAKTFIDTYFQRYSKVREYLAFCKESTREKGYSVTLLGRKRPIPEIGSKNAFLRQAAERLAINTPLQGTAADLIKIAMIDIQKTVDPQYMILQIHDELIFEVPDEELEELGKTVKEKMEGACQLKIPLVVDISIGKNWGEC
ncbi:MAG: DNA polymerase I [Simkaniaceae bacterium]|nr:DNA polymerase I [Candidatus Sacchlamyda saccharinae]